MSTGRARRRETQIHLLPLLPRGEASGGSDPDVVPLTEVVGWAGCAQAGLALGAGSSRGPGCLWFSGGWRIVLDLRLKHKSVWGLYPHPCTPLSPYQVTEGVRRYVQNPACPMALPRLIWGSWDKPHSISRCLRAGESLQLSRGGAVSTCGNTHMPAPLPQDTPIPLPAPHPP